MFRSAWSRLRRRLASRGDRANGPHAPADFAALAELLAQLPRDPPADLGLGTLAAGIPPRKFAGDTDAHARVLSQLIAFNLECGNNSRAFGYSLDNVRRAQAAIAPLGKSIVGARVLELGAGIHNPFGTSLLMLAHGAASTAAVEMGSFDVLASPATAWNWMFAQALFPEHARRVHEALDLASLAAGSLVAAGRPPGLRLHHGAIETFEAGEPFDLVVSNAVCEHLLDYEACVGALAALTAPGGLHVHKIDFNDHDYYEKAAPREEDRLAFLFKPGPGPSGTTNRLRMGEFMDVFARHGLELVRIHERFTMTLPAGVRRRLAPPYDRLSDEDLSTTAATVVLRRR